VQGAPVGDQFQVRPQRAQGGAVGHFQQQLRAADGGDHGRRQQVHVLAHEFRWHVLFHHDGRRRLRRQADEESFRAAQQLQGLPAHGGGNRQGGRAAGRRQQHMRGRQGGMQAQGAARVRVKIVEHDAAVRLAVDEDAGADLARAGKGLALGFAAVVVFHDEGGIAAAGFGAETFQQVDDHGSRGKGKTSA